MPTFPDTLSFAQVRDSIISILGVADASSLTQAKLNRIATAVTTAYAGVLKYHPWPDAIVTSSGVTVTDGLVSLAALQKAVWIEFWTANPGTRSTQGSAQRVYVKRNEAAGYYLDSSASSVFVRYIPEAPIFSAVEVVDATSYAVGDVRFKTSTGHCYVCDVAGLGSTITDSSKWTQLTVLYQLHEATITWAASVYRRLEQEYAQEKALKESAILLLEEMKQPLNSPQ